MFFFPGLELIFPIAFIGLIVMGIVALAQGPREPDPSGKRPYAIYLGLATFVALFVTLFASFATVNAVARWAFLSDDYIDDPLVGSECVSTPTGTRCTGSGQISYGPGKVRLHTGESSEFLENAPLQTEESGGNLQDLAGAIQAAIVLAIALAVLLFHLRRIRALADAAPTGLGDVRATLRGYLYGVCFVAALVFLVGGALALIGLFKVVAPGVAEPHSFGSGGFGFTMLGPSNTVRDQGFVQLFPNLALAAGAALIFRAHWQRAERWRTESNTLGPQDAPPESPGPR